MRQRNEISPTSNLRRKKKASDASGPLEKAGPNPPSAVDLQHPGQDLAAENLALLKLIGEKVATTERLVAELRSGIEAGQWRGAISGIDTDPHHDLAAENLALLQVIGEKLATTERLVAELRSSNEAGRWRGAVPAD